MLKSIFSAMCKHFNSIKVRLEPTINVSYAKSYAHFNSIKVRLERTTGNSSIILLHNFNSIKVRLEPDHQRDCL